MGDLGNQQLDTDMLRNFTYHHDICWLFPMHTRLLNILDLGNQSIQSYLDLFCTSTASRLMLLSDIEVTAQLTLHPHTRLSKYPILDQRPVLSPSSPSESPWLSNPHKVHIPTPPALLLS
jgi:hypothetical protein